MIKVFDTTARLITTAGASEPGVAKPLADFSVRIDWSKQLPLLSPFAVSHDGDMLGQRAEDVRLNLVFLLLGIVSRRTAIEKAPRFINEFRFSDDISALDHAFLVSGFKDVAVAKFESDDAAWRVEGSIRSSKISSSRGSRPDDLLKG